MSCLQLPHSTSKEQRGLFCAFSKNYYLAGLSLSCDSRISTSGKFPHVMRICARGNWLFEGRLITVTRKVIVECFLEYQTWVNKKEVSLFEL